MKHVLSDCATVALVEYLHLWNKEYALNMVFHPQHGKHTAWTVGNVLITGTEIAPGRVLCDFDNFDLQGADNVARRAFQRIVELLRESFSVDDTPSASRAYGIMDRKIERALRVIPALFVDTPLDSETEADFKAHIREKNPDITEEELSSSWQSFCRLVEQQKTKREEHEKRRGMTAEDAVSAWSRKVAGMELTRCLKVFLCHASGDKPAVRELYRRLRDAGFDPWLDEEKLLAGQDWQLEISQAIRSSDAVVICLSRRAVMKAGYVQKEIRHALDVTDEQPEGAIFLIPLRLEACEVPQRLRRWQRVDLFQDQGWERLLHALRTRAESLGLDRHPQDTEVDVDRKRLMMETVSIRVDTTQFGDQTQYQIIKWLASYTSNVFGKQFPLEGGGSLRLEPIPVPSRFMEDDYLEMKGWLYAPEGHELYDPRNWLIRFRITPPGAQAMIMYAECREPALLDYFGRLLENMRLCWSQPEAKGLPTPAEADAGEPIIVSDKLASLRRQLNDKEKRSLLVEERIAKYVISTDVPLQLVREKEQLLENIEELKRHIKELEQSASGELR